MGLEFEWDAKKADANRTRHAVGFEETLSVFRDPLARIFIDEEHSAHESREIIIGYSGNERVILAAFTVRDERIRIISAHKATRIERKDYEENRRQ